MAYSFKKGLNAALLLSGALLEEWPEAKEGKTPVTGAVTGRVEVLWGPQSGFAAKALIPELSVRSEFVNVKNREPLRATFADSTLALESFIISGEGMDLSLSGKVKPGAFYDVRVGGKADLGLILDRVEGVEDASGVAVVDGVISGNWDDPLMHGYLEIPGFSSVKLKKVAFPFEDIRMKVSFENGNSLFLEKLDAKFARGTIHGEGTVGLSNFMPEDLRIFVEARDVDYEFPKEVKYLFDGDFLVTGKPRAPDVRGEVRLKNFSFRQRLKWRTSILNMIGGHKAEQKVTDSLEERPFVDIAISGRDNLKVENNLGEFLFGVDLRVRGRLPSPELIGEVSAREGFIRFRGREYELMRSKVEFLGDTGAGAIIDAAATTTVGQYTVTLSAEGPLSDFRVEMSSEPALQRQDIISLLALGTTSENVSTGDVTAYEATNVLTGGIQDELENQANEVLGIDQFHIDPAYSEAMQSTVPRITVAKALGESLYARYGVLMGAQPEQGLSLEYTLSPGVLLSGAWSDQGKQAEGAFSGELRFRVTFR
ncbi:hypothetical protein FDZ71_00585 [bacterium]|nr:MAG: hypothetical protein FDZ71_00585 [bacterium]